MSQNFTALKEAIRRRATAVIKGRAGDADCRFEMRLVSEGDAPNGEHGVWCELTSGDTTLMERMITVQAPIHVTFDCGRISVSFASGLVLRKRKLFGGDQVLLGWPGKLDIRERRRSERVTIPESVSVPARLIRADSLPVPNGDLPLTLLDLSTTGAGLLCPTGDPPLDFRPGEGLEICLLLMGTDAWIHARHRHTQIMPDGRARIGVEFAPDTGLDSRIQALLQATVELLKAEHVRSTLGAALRRPAHCG